MELNKTNDIKEYMKQYYANNKDRYRANLKRFRMKKKEQEPYKYVLTIMEGGKVISKTNYKRQTEVCKKLNMKSYQVSRLLRKQMRTDKYILEKI